MRDYQNAEKDIDRAITMAPGPCPQLPHTRPNRYSSSYQLERNSSSSQSYDAPSTRASLGRKALNDTADDSDRAISLSPRSAVAYYNKGNILYELEEYDLATAANKSYRA